MRIVSMEVSFHWTGKQVWSNVPNKWETDYNNLQRRIVVMTDNDICLTFKNQVELFEWILLSGVENWKLIVDSY